jgi:riboflavin synthase
MFTGLIAEVGTVVGLHASAQATELELAAPPRLADQVRIGDSVAVNGCCLTVARRDGEKLSFGLLQESLDRTNLGALRPQSHVNLELALAADARLGGHFVQGHVDCAVPILAIEEKNADLRIEVALPREFARYVVFKGSIAINGISLTVTEITPKSFAVWIIPHTLSQTNLADAKPGDLVNLEFDLLAKYVERMLHRE